MKFSKLLGLILLILVLPACSALSGDSLAGTQWKVVSLADTPVLVGSVLTMEFKDGSVSGSAGCNAYGAAYQLNGKKVSVKTASMTLMACPGPGVMEQEQRFMDLTAQVAGFQVADNQLKLLDANGKTLITLVKANPIK